MTLSPKDRIAIVLLNQRGRSIARRIQDAWPAAEIHGLSGRVDGADRTFGNIHDCVSDLYRAGTPIVGMCATGILVRTLAPLLANKHAEPPVLALSDDGQVVVPFLGGLTGANELAEALATITGGVASVTASGSRAYGLQLESPPEGYILANPEDAKRVTSDLLAGKSVRLEGSADFLTNSKLPLTDDGDIPICVTTARAPDQIEGLLYHPRSIAVHLVDVGSSPVASLGEAIEGLLAGDANTATGALGALLLNEGEEFGADVWRELHSTASTFDVPIRYVRDTEGLVSRDRTSRMELLEATSPDTLRSIGRAHGELVVVGLGPGDPGYLTQDAADALAQADDIVGYETYVNLVPRVRANQTTHISGNRVEIERAEQALDLAVQGRRVALVTSGDPGIFAMASAVMEALEAKPGHWTGLDVSILPGISAMQTAAARIGAPIGHDFCTISLSDIRKPWEVVAKRLRAAAEADFVIALYNPASKTRREQIHQTKKVLLDVQSPETIVILGRNLGRPGEDVEVTTLGAFDPDSIDMRTVLVIGSSRTRAFEGPGGIQMVYSPRTYDTE